MSRRRAAKAIDFSIFSLQSRNIKEFVGEADEYRNATFEFTKTIRHKSDKLLVLARRVALRVAVSRLRSPIACLSASVLCLLSSVTSNIYSDDRGKTWRRGEIAVPDTADWVFPNETVAVQLVDGRVMLNSRSESKTHRRLVTFSRDGATGWSTPRFDPALLEPICMASMLRLSAKPVPCHPLTFLFNP